MTSIIPLYFSFTYIDYRSGTDSIHHFGRLRYIVAISKSMDISGPYMGSGIVSSPQQLQIMKIIISSLKIRVEMQKL